MKYKQEKSITISNDSITFKYNYPSGVGGCSPIFKKKSSINNQFKD